MSPFARYLATYFLIPAGIIGAALGLSSAANASTSVASDPRPGIVATPSHKANPAPEATPGWRWHHGVHHLNDLQPGYRR